MIKIVTKYTLEFIDDIKMRQLIEIEKIEKSKENGLTEMEASAMLISSLLVAINDNKDRTTFNDFILDNFGVSELSECSQVIMEIMGEFEKKSQISPTSINASTEDEKSPKK
jgi:hypothetical protein